MSDNSIEQLTSQYSLRSDSAQVWFEPGPAGLTELNVKSDQATARVALQGAHLLSWIPSGQSEVIWLSEDARFEKGKSVRGGIPVCWPWFGAHNTQASFPAHGFARTTNWQLLKVSEEQEVVELCFLLDTQHAGVSEMWPYKTAVVYKMRIGQTLELELDTENRDATDIAIGQALHTYFRVSDLSETRVTGLDGRTYLDKPDAFKRKRQCGDITFGDEVDRVYVDTIDTVKITTSERIISINKQGSASTIVWNPGEVVANKMGDLGSEGYTNMVCVETANAHDDVILLKPGESHKLYARYALVEV